MYDWSNLSASAAPNVGNDLPEVPVRSLLSRRREWGSEAVKPERRERSKHRPSKKTPRPNALKKTGSERGGLSFRIPEVVFGQGGALVVLIVLSLLCIFLHDVVTQTRLFAAKQIEVRGGYRLTKGELLSWTDIRPGMNLLSINLGLARKRLAAHPWVRSAEIRRILPGILKIDIVEQIPLATVSMEEEYLLNTDGALFKVRSPGDPASLPVVTGLTYMDIPLPGEMPGNVFQAVLEILRLARAPDSSLPIKALREIRVDRELGITLITKDDFETVRLGYGDYAAKFERFSKLASHINRRPSLAAATSVDLTRANRIIVKVKETTERHDVGGETKGG